MKAAASKKKVPRERIMFRTCMAFGLSTAGVETNRLGQRIEF
jgi:hypothetical protein